MSMSPLQQPVHILRKDALHVWPETLVSIALLVAFAWAETQTWQPTEGFNPAALAVGLLKFLIPVSWMVLTSRLVHDEELVGDRQFWTTRPYTWYSLLVAKVLYLAVFVGIPFLAIQVWLLHHAGLYPTTVVPGLLKNLLFIAGVFLLPLLAIAAATATFVRYASSVLGGVIYAFAIMVFAAYNWSNNLDAPGLSYLLGAIFILFLAAATLVQYALRKTLIARLTLVALPLVFLLLAIVSPLNLLILHRYPDTSVGTVTFAPVSTPPQPQGRLANVRHTIMLLVPVQIDIKGLADKAFVEEQTFRITLDGPGGFHYTSKWTEMAKPFSPHQTQDVVPFSLPENIFNQIHNTPVSMHMTLGYQIFHPGTPYNVVATEKPFPIPGHAACTVSAETGELECRFPFANREPIQVSATVHNGDCLTPGPESATAAGVLAPSPSPFGFTPVELTATRLGLGEQRVALCPGTTTTFTSAVEGDYGRLHLDILAITLDSYAHRFPVRETAPQPR